MGLSREITMRVGAGGREGFRDVMAVEEEVRKGRSGAVERKAGRVMTNVAFLNLVLIELKREEWATAVLQ